MIRKVVVSFVALFLFLFSPALLMTSVSAQDFGLCGVAGQPPYDACCVSSGSNLPGIPLSWILKKIPGVGYVFKKYDEIRSSLDTMSHKYTQACYLGVPNGAPGSPGCVCKDVPNALAARKLGQLCAEYFDPKFYQPGSDVKKINDELDKCIKCASQARYYSGLGCIPLELEDLISDYIFKYGLGIAGFTALMCIIISAVQMQVSQGNPEKLTKAKENITSCLIGLILIIFSVFILEVIGIHVLGIFGS